MRKEFLKGARTLASAIHHEIDRLDEDFREKGKNYYESDYYYGIARGFKESRMAVERMLSDLEGVKGDSYDFAIIDEVIAYDTQKED